MIISKDKKVNPDTDELVAYFLLIAQLLKTSTKMQNIYMKLYLFILDTCIYF